jgi:hypothetical protein
MNKEFKHRQSASKPRGSGLLLGLFVGFLLGLATAAAIAIYVFKTPMPFSNKTVPAGKPGEKAPDAGTLGKAGKAKTANRVSISIGSFQGRRSLLPTSS